MFGDDTDETQMGTSHLTVGLDVDGYDVQVNIPAATIKREIQRTEKEKLREVSWNGGSAFNLSKFVTVNVELTDDKWKEVNGEVFDND